MACQLGTPTTRLVRTIVYVDSREQRAIAAYCTGLLCARRLLTKLGLDKRYQGNTDVNGEDYYVEAVADGPAPFYCLLDVGLRRTTYVSRRWEGGGGDCTCDRVCTVARAPRCSLRSRARATVASKCRMVRARVCVCVCVLRVRC
jgi:hypothetical protein